MTQQVNAIGNGIPYGTTDNPDREINVTAQSNYANKKISFNTGMCVLPSEKGYSEQ